MPTSTSPGAPGPIGIIILFNRGLITPSATIDSINKWKNELESGDKLLRDIIDLDSSVEQDENINVEETNINMENKSKFSLLDGEDNNVNLHKSNNENQNEDKKKAKDEETLEYDEEELDDEIEEDQDNSSMSLAMLENLVRDQVMLELGEFSSKSKKILKHQSKSIEYLLKGEKIHSQLQKKIFD